MNDKQINERQPVLFLSHGAPPLADDPVWTRELREWGSSVAKPKSILMVSAHWEAAPLALGATTTVPLVYDFYGFPPEYYEVKYPAPGAPELARSVKKLLSKEPIQETDRGLDHGSYVPLVEMYPDADIPVLQMSMPTLEPSQLFELGKRLAPLRDEGVLIVGSGYSTHNLRAIDWSGDVAPFISEFDRWLAEALENRDVDALVDFESKAPAAVLAHPRTEHFAPLFVSLGATHGSYDELATPVEGFAFGMSKRSVQFN